MVHTLDLKSRSSQIEYELSTIEKGVHYANFQFFSALKNLGNFQCGRSLHSLFFTFTGSIVQYFHIISYEVQGVVLYLGPAMPTLQVCLHGTESCTALKYGGRCKLSQIVRRQGRPHSKGIIVIVCSIFQGFFQIFTFWFPFFATLLLPFCNILFKT